MVPERNCLLLEDPSLHSLSSCLNSMGWQPLLFDLDEGEAAIQSASSCTMGIIHSHVLTAAITKELADVTSRLPNINWILVTSPETIHEETAKEFTCKHCSWFITENISDSFSNATLKPKLGTLLEQGLEMSLLQHTQHIDNNEIITSTQFFTGDSEKMCQLLKQTKKAAAVDIPVLIIGESGTGKELIAKSIHEQSERAEYPFVAINCGAIPDTLIQSELFGHERGSFTGADKRYIGKFEQAQHGTLFLDEIAELPLNQQVNLLRFLQEKTVERLGGNKLIKLDIRIVAATHQNLEKAVAQGAFREDLYYRLAVLQLETPPLRHDKSNIQCLAEHILAQNTLKTSLAPMSFSADSLIAMTTYHWPGNVRELINRIQRAVVMCEGNCIEPEDLALSHYSTKEAPANVVAFSGKLDKSLNEIKQCAETEAILRALQENDHNISLASKKLKISRASMYRLMQKYELH